MKTDSTENLCLWCMEEMGENPVCPHCAHDREKNVSEEQCLKPGTLLNHERYLLGRVIGAGGFGITYLAYDCVLQIKRAVKEFYPRSLVFRSGSSSIKTSGISHGPAFEKGLDSFHKEATSLARFGAHPNVVKIHDYFEENGTAYFVMDYIEGQSFSAYLKSHGNKLGWEETLRILSPIGDALSALHAAGLMHRDVKPDNIFITREGKSILLDFGAARYATSGETNSLTAVLTPGYAPIEQYGTKNQGSWTDVYALAATFYHAVSGITPPISTERIAEDELRPLRELDPGIPDFVSTATSQGLKLKVADRVKTVEDFLAGFTACPPPPSPSAENLCPLCFAPMGSGSVCPECGYKLCEDHYLEKEFLPLGTMLGGRYQIGKCLDVSENSIIYLAYDCKKQMKCAVKEYYPRRIASRIGVSVRARASSAEQNYEEGLKSFFSQAQIIEKHKHPGMLKVNGCFRENNTAYVVMEYEKGESLQHYLDSHGGKISWEKACALLRPVSDALSFLNGQNLPHKNITPNTIWITPQEKTIILPHFDSDDLYDPDMMLLPCPYAPVESFGCAVNQSSCTDVYMFAATLYRTVSGIVPQVSYDRIIDDRLIPLKKLDPAIPEEFSDAVQHAMALRAFDRTQTVEQFISDATPPLSPDPPPPLLIRLRKYILIVILLVLAMGVFVWKFKENDSGGTVISDEIRNAQVADHIYYGHYEQDNDPANGAEAIEWRVIERRENQLLLLSEYALDVKPYNETNQEVTWEKCTLRRWLNKDFYQNAFSTEEQKKITKMTLKNWIYSESGFVPDKDTQDKIFLLSGSETNQYIGGEEDRLCKATVYSKEKKAYINNESGSASLWWIREPGPVVSSFAYVGSDGNFYYSSCEDDSIAVRPAFWLSF